MKIVRLLGILFILTLAAFSFVKQESKNGDSSIGARGVGRSISIVPDVCTSGFRAGCVTDTYETR